MAYGTTAKVAELTPRYADSGDFTASTTPTKTAVENYLNRVSAVADAYLATLGFSIPVTDTDAVLLVEQVVLETVAHMVEGVRGTGRYAPNNKAVAQRGMLAVLTDDVQMYLDRIATGLEIMGAGRVEIVRIGFNDNAAPLFKVSDFGNS